MNPPPLPSVQHRASAAGLLRMAVVSALVVGGAVVLFLHNPTPAPGRTSYLPACPFYKLTSLYCPGCGTTRGLHHLLHGRVATAFDFNPLMVVSLPFVGYALGRAAARAVLPDRFPARRPLAARWVWAILVLVISFGIARNLPYKPVAWMAP